MSDQSFITPLQAFYQWERQCPKKIFLSQPLQGDLWRDYTWADVGQQARIIARALQDRGLKHGDTVGLSGANSAYWVITDLAIMMAGGVSVPVYASMPADKLQYIVNHSDMKILFTDAGDASSINNLAATVGDTVTLISLGDEGTSEENTPITPWGSLLEKVAPIDGSPLRPDNDLWTISYTSGTTGMPKGVMHSFSTMPRFAATFPQLALQDDNAVFFSFLPLAHIAERAGIEIHALYAGARIYFNKNLDTFAQDLLHARPTFFFAVPRIWHKLKQGIIESIGDETWQQVLQDPKLAHTVGKQALTALGLERVTTAFSGSAPIAKADLEAWATLGLPLYEGYGQTEHLAGLSNRPGAVKVGSIGTLQLVEELAQIAQCKVADNGELLLRGQATMLGYYKDPEKTAETIVDGWLHTGDKVRVDEDGFVFITGRVKEIFKTAKGKYVAPAPIEDKFGSLNLLEQLCLVGRGMPQTVLLVVLTEQSSTLERDDVDAQLWAALDSVNTKLEAHERISHIIICQEPWTPDNGLLTPTLKMKRDEIEEKMLSLVEASVNNSTTAIVWEAP